jgi:hypothetical protein
MAEVGEAEAEVKTIDETSFVRRNAEREADEVAGRFMHIKKQDRSRLKATRSGLRSS